MRMKREHPLFATNVLHVNLEGQVPIHDASTPERSWPSSQPGLPTSPPQDPSPQGSPQSKAEDDNWEESGRPHTELEHDSMPFVAMGKSKRNRTGWSPFSAVR